MHCERICLPQILEVSEARSKNRSENSRFFVGGNVATNDWDVWTIPFVPPTPLQKIEICTCIRYNITHDSYGKQDRGKDYAQCDDLPVAFKERENSHHEYTFGQLARTLNK